MLLNMRGYNVLQVSPSTLKEDLHPPTNTPTLAPIPFYERVQNAATSISNQNDFGKVIAIIFIILLFTVAIFVYCVRYRRPTQGRANTAMARDNDLFDVYGRRHDNL